jgi:hypothetical protein
MLTASGGQPASLRAPGTARAIPAATRVRSKTQLRVGAARWVCSGHRPERSAWVGSYVRVLLTPARCADLPPAARETGQRGRAGGAERRTRAPVAGSDAAERRRAASPRRGGFAQSCGRRRSFDSGYSATPFTYGSATRSSMPGAHAGALADEGAVFTARTGAARGRAADAVRWPEGRVWADLAGGAP